MTSLAPAYSQNLPDCSADLELYSLLDAALLWCGVPEGDLDLARADCNHEGRGIWSNEYIPCLKKKTIAMHCAIDKGALRAVREHGDGGPVYDEGKAIKDHVAYDRRHFWGVELKAYIAQYHPDDKPDFLFSEAEKKPPVDTDEYQRMNGEYTKLQAEKIQLQAEINRLQIELAAAKSEARDAEAAKHAADDRLEKAKNYYREQRGEIESLKAENVSLQERLNAQPKTASAKAANMQASIIAALAMMYTKTDCAMPYEAAETIRQEWERRADTIGGAPKVDTIAGYIKTGINALSK